MSSTKYESVEDSLEAAAPLPNGAPDIAPPEHTETLASRFFHDITMFCVMWFAYVGLLSLICDELYKWDWPDASGAGYFAMVLMATVALSVLVAIYNVNIFSWARFYLKYTDKPPTICHCPEDGTPAKVYMISGVIAFLPFYLTMLVAPRLTGCDSGQLAVMVHTPTSAGLGLPLTAELYLAPRFDNVSTVFSLSRTGPTTLFLGMVHDDAFGVMYDLSAGTATYAGANISASFAANSTGAMEITFADIERHELQQASLIADASILRDRSPYGGGGQVLTVTRDAKRMCTAHFEMGDLASNPRRLATVAFPLGLALNTLLEA